MKKLHHAWRKTPAVIRKPSVFIAGWFIVIGGLILIPLPGPGWAIVFVGFAVLATEFASAKRTHEFMVGTLKKIINWFSIRWNRLTKKKPKTK
jgi:uncharacterized protein (TIGR02611 family)